MPKLETLVKKLLEKKHTNIIGDGLCPWCNVGGCNPNCDLGKLRNFIQKKREIL